MFKRIFKNLGMGIYFIFRPSAFTNKVKQINNNIDENFALNVVGKSVVKELEKFQLKHPKDKGITYQIDFFKKWPIEDKEDVKEMIFEKQKILEKEVKYCPKCHASYVYFCGDHEEDTTEKESKD